MQLTDQDIEEFRQGYRAHCGQEISKEQAADYAGRVLRLMQLIYQPMRKRDMAVVEAEVEALRTKYYRKLE